MKQPRFLHFLLIFLLLAFPGAFQSSICKAASDRMSAQKPMTSPSADQTLLHSTSENCPTVKIEAERLPDMSIARCTHAAFFVNGEIVVAGGHTTGFIPTATAEYYHDGQWHTLPMLYTHDGSLAVVLRSGKVLLAGGLEKPFGIGQSFSTELYDPASHSFESFGILDMKRALLSGVELDDGRVLMSGNWYGGDSLEIYDGQKSFSFVKDVSMGRAAPYVLRIAADDAIVFGRQGVRGETYDSIVADRLKGASFRIPLLEQWHPQVYGISMDGNNYFIGDEAKGDYSNLIVVENDEKQVAFVKVNGTDFSLLPTVCPVPMIWQGDSITYGNPFVDRERKFFYVIGCDKSFRWYVLRVDYSQSPAPLTLFYTDPFPEIVLCRIPALMPNGNIVLTGGVDEYSNFKPAASVYVLPVNKEITEKGTTRLWIWGLLALAGVGIIAYFIKRQGARSEGQENIIKEQVSSSKQEEASSIEQVSSSKQEEVVEGGEIPDSLLPRICQLMEEEKLYLNSKLKLDDVAERLHTNRLYVSTCINNERGCSFSQFVNAYRVEYAQRLLRKHPHKKLIEVSIESGFANEMTFFRVFKSFTGMTPREWSTKDND